MCGRYIRNGEGAVEEIGVSSAMADPLSELPPDDRQLLLLRHPCRLEDTGPPPALISHLYPSRLLSFPPSLVGRVHGLPLKL